VNTESRHAATLLAFLMACACSQHVVITLPPGGSKQDEAVASAVGWLLRTVDASIYTVEVNGTPASAELLALVMSVAPDVTSSSLGSSGLFEIQAAGPILTDPTLGTVSLRYRDPEGAAQHACVVSVRESSSRARRWLVEPHDCPPVQ